MESNGVMAEIRTLLSQGKSSGEVISMGFKPSTVYKVLRQLRGGQGTSAASAPGSSQPSSNTAASQPEPGLEVENIRLQQEVEDLEGQFECIFDGYVELQDEVRTHEQRAIALETNAAAVATQLRQRVMELEGRLAQAADTEATMYLRAVLRQQKFDAEIGALHKAEAQVNELKLENQELRQLSEEWQQWAIESYQTYQNWLQGQRQFGP